MLSFSWFFSRGVDIVHKSKISYIIKVGFDAH